jgi:hypothetical protein
MKGDPLISRLLSGEQPTWTALPEALGSVENDPQETCAGQDFRDAKMIRCGQRLRDRSPRGRSQPERVRRIGAPMSVSEKDTRDVARIWTDRRIPAACRGAVFMIKS